MRTASLILSFLLLCLSANAQPQEFMHNGAKYRLFPDQPRYAELVEDSTARDTVRIPSFVDYESIPREVKKIAWHAYWNASPSIVGFDIPQTVDTLEGGWADGNLPNIAYLHVHPLNPSYMSEDNVIYTRRVTELVKYAELKPDTIFTVPATVLRIGVSAFAGSQNLRQVVLPQNLHIIGPWAFSGCPQLREVNIPPYLMVVNVNAFTNCPNLPAAFIADPIQYARNKAEQQRQQPQGLSEMAKMYLMLYGKRTDNDN